MNEELSERVAAAVLRAWIETGPKRDLRVRITDVVDLERGTSRIHPVATSIEDACAIVRDWLTEFVESASLPTHDEDRR